MKKETWILLGIGAAVLFLLTRRAPAAKPPVTNSGTGTNRDILSSWLDNIRNHYSSQSPDNTPGLVTAAGNAFSSVTGAFSKLFNGSTSSAAGSVDIGSGVPLPPPDTVTDYNLPASSDNYQYWDWMGGTGATINDYLNYNAADFFAA